MLDFKIWATNKFNPELMQELVAAFATLEQAKEYTDFKASQGESYIVMQNGARVYPED